MSETKKTEDFLKFEIGLKEWILWYLQTNNAGGLLARTSAAYYLLTSLMARVELSMIQAGASQDRIDKISAEAIDEACQMYARSKKKGGI